MTPRKLLLAGLLCLCAIAFVTARSACEEPAPLESKDGVTRMLKCSKGQQIGSIQFIDGGRLLLVSKSEGRKAEYVLMDRGGKTSTLCRAAKFPAALSISARGTYYSITSRARGVRATVTVCRADGEEQYQLEVTPPASKVVRVTDDGASVVLMRKLSGHAMPMVTPTAFAIYDGRGQRTARIPRESFITGRYQVSGDGSVIAIGDSSEGCVRVYEAITGRQLHELPYSGQIAMSSNGNTIALPSCRTMNPRTTVFKEGTLIGSAARGGRVMLSPAGKYLCQFEEQGKIAAYEVASMRRACTVSFDPSNATVLSAVADNGLFVVHNWITDSSRETAKRNTAELLVFAHDGREILRRSYPAWEPNPVLSPILRVALAPEGDQLLAATRDGEVLRFDLPTTRSEGRSETGGPR